MKEKCPWLWKVMVIDLNRLCERFMVVGIIQLLTQIIGKFLHLSIIKFQVKLILGNIHFPPNGIKDYDWINKTKVTSYADAWKNYPYITENNSRIVDCHEWKCSHLGYMTWWMRHIPHFKGINPEDGKLNNWWHYVVDYNAAVKKESKLIKQKN